MTKTNKNSTTSRGKAGSQSPFLKSWFARKRSEERNASSSNSHVLDVARAPTLASVAVGVATVQPQKGVTRQKPLASKASVTPDSDVDLFGRPIHRYRDAVRNAGRRAVGRPPRSSWKKFLWPLIGQGLELVDGRTFNWVSHREAFDDSLTVTVYVATCDALCSLGSRAKIPLAKVGISERIDLNERMDELNAIGYGSIVRDKMGACQVETGFGDWHPLSLPLSARPDHDSPVEWSPTRLLVSLPSSLEAEVFDMLLKAALAPSAIVTWSSTEDGILHCARADIDQRALLRYSAYPLDDGDLRISVAEEIYCFRPALDPAVLVKIIESLIARHLVEQMKADIGARSTAQAGTSAPGAMGKLPDLFPQAPKPAWPLFWTMTLKVSS